MLIVSMITKSFKDVADHCDLTHAKKMTRLNRNNDNNMTKTQSHIFFILKRPIFIFVIDIQTA